MLKFFMGKNTPERQQYIIRNLRYELDIVEKENRNSENSKTATKKVNSSSSSDLADSEAA
jgi:hypothetical protein